MSKSPQVLTPAEMNKGRNVKSVAFRPIRDFLPEEERKRGGLEEFQREGTRATRRPVNKRRKTSLEGLWKKENEQRGGRETN